MTLTSKTMEWLNQNRRRSYPMIREEWRKKVSPESGMDSVLLDALAFNNDAAGDEKLELESVEVTSSAVRVLMRYSGSTFPVEFSGGATSGEDSYRMMRITVPGSGMRDAVISLSFSSHAYILDAMGEGKWEIGCRVLQSRVISLPDGFGVDGIAVKGSACVEGHENPAIASGDVVLEDGFRTSPIIHGGKVLVRVGKKFGLNPCHYKCGGVGEVDCDSPMFFFCGQNAVNGANVAITGGKGISVEQGRLYTVKTGPRAGRKIPCIEITANSELMDIYRPTDGSGDQNV